jgi:hypothetical protein
VFFTASPWTTSRTASSTILPLIVRGISATWTIFAGTWRGDSALADLAADSRATGRRRAPALAQHHEQHHAHVVLPVLADHDASSTSGICSTWR